MLTKAVDTYIAMRRACGFAFQTEGTYLRGFAAYSDAKGYHYVRSDTAVEWARQGRSACQRARRLGHVIRFARYAHAEDARHELPVPSLGPEKSPRPVPYIFSFEDIQRLMQSASQSGYRTLRRSTYYTLFGLLACTGLRLSEAIHLRYADITADGLVIRRTKFKKSRLVPLHATARAALARYLEKRRPYAPMDDHVFISLRRKPLLVADAERAFRTAADKIGLRREAGRPRPTLHALRHTFAVRALETSPDDRDRVTQHMVALSTYLGHGHVAHTYWYLEATPQLMRDVSERCERFVTGGQP
jgi:integrase/recombinase XerD